MDPTGAAGLRELLERVRAWESGSSAGKRRGEALKRRVAGEIEPYLGKHAAHSILEPVADDGRNLLPSVSPLLTIFLGGRATEYLVSRVVERAIVRI
jgi:hypothetical protein